MFIFPLDFPPIMDDGRNYAKWQPGAAINQQIREENNIKSNWQYRQYLTNNADKIIKSNQVAACDNCCYCPAEYNSQSTSNSPFLYCQIFIHIYLTIFFYIDIIKI